MSTQPPEPKQVPKTEAQRSRERLIYLALIGLGVMVTLIFGLRFLRMAPHLRGLRPGPPPVGSAAVEGWMTLPHIAQITHVPEARLWQEVGLSPAGNRHRSLETLQIELDQADPNAPPLLTTLQQAVDEFQRGHPQPASPPPPPETPGP